MIENKEILDYICRFCADVSYFSSIAMRVLQGEQASSDWLFDLSQKIFKESKEYDSPLNKICEQDENIAHIIYHFKNFMINVIVGLKRAGIKPWVDKFPEFTDCKEVN